MKKIILASASPRRKELLLKHGIDFEVIVSNALEDSLGDNPKSIAINNSKLKALDVYNKIKVTKDAYILAADTIVCLNNEIFGKPKDRLDAKKMLNALSGQVHEVITGICVIDTSINPPLIKTLSETTKVKFKKLSDSEIIKHINTDEPYDKAGAYAIQGEAKKFIEEINGDLENVIGLPVIQVLRLINEGEV